MTAALKCNIIFSACHPELVGGLFKSESRRFDKLNVTTYDEVILKQVQNDGRPKTKQSKTQSANQNLSQRIKKIHSLIIQANTSVTFPNAFAFGKTPTIFNFENGIYGELF